MKITIKIITILLIIGQMNSNYSQNLPYRFEHYTISDGISNNSINSIIQTKDGYLWVATKDGLNRYNGQTFQIFKNDRFKKNTLPENYVMTLLQTKDYSFWVGTWGGGLCKYNFKKESFESYNLDEKGDDFIQAMIEDSVGNLWIGTLNGCLYKYSIKDKKVNSYKSIINSANDIKRNNITALSFDSNGLLWIATWGDGIILYDIKTNTIKKEIKTYPLNKIKSDYIWFLEACETDCMLICTNKGLEKYNYRVNRTIAQNEMEKSINALFDKSIRITYLDSNKRLWVGSWNYQGLLVQNTINPNSEILFFKKEIYDQFSITSNRIRSIYEDTNKNIWIGTEDGLNKISPTKQFIQYRFEPVKKNTIGGNVTSSICQGKDGLLYVGYAGGGFDVIDIVKNSIKHYGFLIDNVNSLSHDDVLGIFQDKDAIVWIATSSGGLNRFDPITKMFKKYIHLNNDKFSINSNWVQKILETKDGKLLVGTNDGLQEFDRKTEKFYTFSPKTEDGSAFPNLFSTNSLYEDSKENIWVGTWLDGVYCYNKKSNIIEHYLPDAKNPNSLSSTKVSTILEDSNGFIWFGTHSGGINKYDPRNKMIYPITTQNGLPNDVVFGILEDNNRNLWISTMDGLVKYNPNKNKFRVYDFYDGLVSDQFNWQSYYKNKDGLMFFGGIGGFIYFNPGSISIEKNSSPVVFTSFKIFGKESILPQSLSLTKEINLEYDQNFFSIDFSVMDFAPKNKHSFSYMLNGVDPKWVEAGNRTTAFYTNIEPGNYVFNVKSSNPDGVWSETKAIIIIISPAWWMTWWFKIFSILFVSLLVYAGLKYRVRRLLEIQNIRLSIASDLHDEIGSNLSSISVDSQLLINSKYLVEKDKTLATFISKTAQETIESMRDIIWFIYPKNDTSADIIIKMKDTAKKILIGINWHLDTIGVIHFENLDLDVRRNIFLIFKECLTNVVKHAQAKNCWLLLEQTNNEFKLSIKDDGIGFDVNNIKENYGIANMNRRARTMNASLLMESKIGEGTQISLAVPLKITRRYFSTNV